MLILCTVPIDKSTSPTAAWSRSTTREILREPGVLELLDGSGDLEPDAGQELTDLVVQRASELAAFFLAGRLEMR